LINKPKNLSAQLNGHILQLLKNTFKGKFLAMFEPLAWMDKTFSKLQFAKLKDALNNLH